jgi:prepilin-type N-terminal cleavage/methylation domain-containing protein
MRRPSPTLDTSSRSTSGFTLIELITVVALVLIVTSALLLVRPRADQQTVLRNTATEVVLFMRQAQAYGSGVRSAGTGQFQHDYGVSVHNSSNTQFNMFSEAMDAFPKRNVHMDGATQLLSTLDLAGTRVTIERFCLREGMTLRCSNSGPPMNHLGIVFRRPSLDARIFGRTGGGVGTEVIGNYAFICLARAGSTQRMKIEVFQTGLMQVTPAPNCNS